MSLSWNHSICERCWIDREATYDDDMRLTKVRRPTVLIDPDLEKCAFCGMSTIMGIFVRQDPTTVRFPKEKVDD